MITIYGLTDPRTGHLRYVGQSRRRLATRLWMHCRLRPGDRSHRACWIGGLLRAGLRPAIEILEMVSLDDGDVAERFHIASLRAAGAQLVNLADGGHGSRGRLGKRNSPEHNAKIAAAHVGITPSTEVRLEMSRARRGRGIGRKHTPEAREKIRQAAIRQHAAQRQGR